MLISFHMLDHFQAMYHAKQVDGFVETHGKDYASIKIIKHDENIKEWHARNLGVYVFLFESMPFLF